MTRIVERRFFDLERQAEERYPRIELELPPRCESFEVRLRYDRARGVIDLGCEGPAGWRGWSGGARDGFVLGREDATPGYCPGPLEPGVWAVVLGIHAVPAEGLEVEVEVLAPAEAGIDHGRVPPPGRPAVRGSARGLPALPGLRWYAGDFHAHTLHSDGAESVSQLASRAARAGLDFLAVTEHNTVSHHRHLGPAGARHGIALIPGQEITTHRGHANAFGDIGFVDFRQPGQAWMEEVAARGGIFSVNHPVADDCAWLFPLDRAPGAVELWHGTWYRDLGATAPLAWHAAWPHRPPLVGGSDFHSVGGILGPGAPTTWVAAEEPGPEAILAGLRAGRTAITGGLLEPDEEGVRAPALLTAPALVRLEGELVAVDADGLALVDAHGRRRVVRGDRVRFEADPGRGPYVLMCARRRCLALSV